MMNDELKFLFWVVVSECLIEFHGLQRDEAYKKPSSLRSRLKELGQPKKMNYPSDAGDPNDMVYHEEPFYLACSIAGNSLKLEEPEYKEKYQSLLGVHGWLS